MHRTFLVALIAFVAGSLSSILVRDAAYAETTPPDRSMAGIEALHRKDVAATLAGDPDAFAGLWTEDAVRLEPGGPAEIGRSTILANDRRSKAENPGVKTVSYDPQVKNIRLLGDWAVEWGYFDSSYRKPEETRPRSFRGKMLRVLKRGPDGSWRFARVMWNLAE